MMKRLISEILMLCVILLNINLTEAVNADEIVFANPIGNIRLIYEDFSDDNILTDVYGDTEIADVNGEKCLSIGGDAASFFGKLLDDKPTSDRYCFSYDFYSESEEYTLVCRIIESNGNSIYNTSDALRCLEFESGGAVNVYRSAKGNTDRKLRGEWDSASRHSVALWIDTENNEAEYWLDGVRIANIRLEDELCDFKGFSVEKPIADCAAKLYIDNVCVSYDADDEVSAFSPIFTEYSVGDEVIGNNFFMDFQPEFELSFKNRIERSINAEISFSAVDENGVVRWKSQNSAYTFEPKESVSMTAVPTPYCGVMKLVVAINVGREGYEKIIPYSMSNRTSAMPVNKRSGAATHIDRGKESAEKILPLLNRAGFGTIRDGVILWAETEQEKGIYKFPKKYDDFLALCRKYNIDYINYFRGHGIYGQPGDLTGYPPSDEEAYSALEKFMAEVAKWSNGRIFAMEVFNEFNNSNMTGPYAQKYDVFANLHKAIWNGLRKYDSDIYVAGLAEDNWSTNVMQITEEYMKAMDGGIYFDSVATHPYVPDFDVPERGVTDTLKNKTTQSLEKYGYNPELPRFATEIGWSSAMCEFNDKEQGCYFPRIMQLTLMENSLDRVCWYSAADYPDVNDENMSEATYGLVEGCSGDDVEVPYLAKSGFVMAAYYNNLFAEAVPVSDYSDEEVFSYHSKSRNGNDILMLGVIDDLSVTVSYNLGCSSVMVGDAYGNEYEFCSDSGVYDFVLNPNEVTYIQGNFDNIVKCKSRFSVNEINRTIDENDQFEIRLTADEGFDGTLSVDSAYGIEVLSADTAVKGGIASVSVKVLPQKAKTARLTLKIEKNGETYFFPTMEWEYTVSPVEAAEDICFETDFEVQPKFLNNTFKGAGAELVFADENHQKTMYVYREYENTDSGSAESIVNFEKPVNNGVLKIGFDIKVCADSTEALQYLYIVDKRGMKDCFSVLGTTPDSSYVNGWRGYKAELPAMTEDEWSCIDIVIDFDNDCAYLYRDGVLIDYSKELMADEIYGIMFQLHARDATGGGIYIDNLKISTGAEDMAVKETKLSEDKIRLYLNNTLINSDCELVVEIARTGTDEKIKADVTLTSGRYLELITSKKLEHGEEYVIRIPEGTMFEDVFGNKSSLLTFNLPNDDKTIGIVNETFDDSKWNKISFNPHWINGRWPQGWYPTVGGQYDKAMEQICENGEYYMKFGDGAATSIPHSPSGSGLKYALPELPEKSAVTVRYDVKILPGSGTTPNSRAGLSSAAFTQLAPSNIDNSQNLRLGFDIGFTGSSGATDPEKFVRHGGAWVTSVENIENSVFNADNWYTCETVWNIDKANSKTYAQYRAWDRLSGEEAFSPLTGCIPSLSSSFVPKAVGAVFWGSERTTQILLDNMNIFYTYTPTGVKKFRVAEKGESKLPGEIVSANTDSVLVEFTSKTDAEAYLVEENGNKNKLSGKVKDNTYEWNTEGLLEENRKYTLSVVYDGGDKCFERSLLTIDEGKAEIAYYGIYNADGSAVTRWRDITDSVQLYVNAEIGIANETAENAVLVFELSEKGVLLDVGYADTGDSTTVNGRYFLKKEFSLPENCDEIKCFLWTGGKSMKPIIPAKTVLK